MRSICIAFFIFSIIFVLSSAEEVENELSDDDPGWYMGEELPEVDLEGMSAVSSKLGLGGLKSS